MVEFVYGLTTAPDEFVNAVPPPLGVAHDQSPRKNVELLALPVGPRIKLVDRRLPKTPLLAVSVPSPSENPQLYPALSAQCACAKQEIEIAQKRKNEIKIFICMI
jgi:hypothetical protein